LGRFTPLSSDYRDDVTKVERYTMEDTYILSPLENPEIVRSVIKIVVMAMSNTTPERFELVFTVPPSALQACKHAVFVTGAGVSL